MPVLVGVIDTETLRVIEHIKLAEELGADAVVATAPFYALGGVAEIEEHFRLLHNATSLPLFAYDIPVCVHTKIPWKLLLKLGMDGVLAGVKDSSGDDISFRYLCQANERAGHPLQLLTGHEIVVDGAYLSGADGSVPGLANVDPDSYVQMWNCAQAGKWQEVKELQDKVNDLSHIFDATSGVCGYGAGVGAFKCALHLMGVFDTAQMLPPVHALEGENIEAIRHILVQCGLL